MLKRLLSIPLIECKGTTKSCFLVLRFLVFFILFSLKPFFSFAQFPYEENFRNDFTNRPVIFGGSPHPAFLTAQQRPANSNRTFDVMGQGFLQLTPDSTFQTGYVYSNDVFPGTYGLHIELDYFTHGGNGADGISFFLFDAAVQANAFEIGAFGGSLGYSQRSNIDGVSMGYLGIGLDEYGNFSNNGEGRIGGVSNSPNTLYPNRVALRGAGNGQTGAHNYEYLTSTPTIVGNVGFPIAGNNRYAVPNDPTYRKLIIDLAPKTLGKPADGIIINVSIQHGGPGDITNLIKDYPYPVPIPAAGLKYGLSSSTGGSYNFHEIRGLEMTVNPNFLIQPVAQPFSGSNCQRQTIVIPDFLKNADKPNAGGVPTPSSVLLNGSPLTYTKQGVGVFTYDTGQDAIIFVPDPNFIGTSTIPYTYTDFYGKVSTVANITVTTVTPTVAPLTGDVTICAGQTFTSSVSVVGSVSSLKWQFHVPGAGPDDWNDVVLGNGTSVASGTSPSGVTNTLTITNVPAGSNGYQYRALITPLAGGQCANVPSSPVNLTVNALPVASISPSTSACLKSPDVPVVFTGANGTAPYTFTYTITSTIGGVTTVSNVLTGVTSSTDPTFIAKQPATTAGTFVYNILSVTGSSTSCVNTQGVQSTVVVNAIPGVAISPLSQSVCEGSAPIPITFTGSGGTGPFVISYTLTSATAAGTVKSDVLTVTTTGSNPFILMQPTTVPGTFTYDVLSILNTATNCSFTPRQFSVESTIVIIPNATMVAAPESGAVNPAVCVGTPMVPIIFNVKDARSVSGEANPVAPGVTWSFDPVKMQVTISGTPTQVGTFPYDFTTLGGCSFAEVAGEIIVNPLATVDKPADQIKCNQTASDRIVFTGSLNQTTFNWVNSNTAIGLADHGTGNIESFTATNNTNAPIEATITVTPVSISGCTGSPVTFTITVNPTVTVNSVSNQIKCNGAATDNITFSGTVDQTYYNWRNDHPEIGLASQGTGNIGTFTATNTTGVPIVATITVTPVLAFGCPGTPVSFTITVNPTATVNHVADQVYCNGLAVAVFPFGSNAAATTYTWTNSNDAIGLGLSGTGGLPAFTATNSTGVPIVSTITVTPAIAADGCAGPAINFTITVNPTAKVNPVTNQVYCNGAPVAVFPFGSNVAATTYTWTNSNDAIGLGLSGTGGLPAFTATNTTRVPIVSTITVTPAIAADGCAGPAINFTITVNPTAKVNPVTNQVYCNSLAVAAFPFGSNAAATTYTWTNSNDAIGLGLSGTGGLPAFTATNTTGVPIVSTITVTPAIAADGCAGPAITFTITVNPTAKVNPVTNQVYCNGAPVALFPFGSNAAATTYTWTNSNDAIGLGLSGTGGLPAFTATNTTGVPIVSTITVTPAIAADGCAGPAINFTITVNPTATVNHITDQVYCNEAPVTAFSFGSNVAATTYTWTNNNTNIGLGDHGIGGLPAFTATNTTGVPIVSTITVTPAIAADGCAGPAITFTITVNPTAKVNPVTNQVYCNGAPVALFPFGSNVAATTYTWTNSNDAIGLGLSGTGSLPAFTAANTTGVPIVSTITVTPAIAADGCAGPAITFTITVNPTANVNPVTNQVYCNGAPVTAFPFGSNVAATTYTWTNSNDAIGLGLSGTGGLPAFTATNTTGVPVTSTITVTPAIAADGCAGPAITFTITVNPTAKVNPVTNQVYCNGAPVALFPFGSNVAATTYTWTNSNDAIGLGLSGTGNLPAFTATNTTGAPITAIITVTPSVASADGCAGEPVHFTITVKPTANVNVIPNEIYCNDQAIPALTFGSNVSTTTYTWSNNNTNIGLAATGNGNLPAFTATNTTGAPITATITVTPVVSSADGCAGEPVHFMITVKPTANVNVIPNEVYCNDQAIPALAFGSNVSTTTYTWSNNNTNIGLAATGNGNLPAFTATNTTGAPITAIITVTPSVASADGCAGEPVSFTITVKPTANVNVIPNEIYCNDQAIPALAFGSNVSTTTYTWSNNNTNIGLAATGNGNLPAFTATNTTGAPITAIITVTPSVASTDGCAGEPVHFTIIVKPTANVNVIPNEIYCNNQAIPALAFGSNVTSTTYTWSNSNTNIGLAATGNGNLPAFTATNTTGAPITATITVTPSVTSANGCAGEPVTFTITVKPTANVNVIPNEVYCNDQAIPVLAFGSNVTSTTYTWSNNNTNIGLAATGNGNLPAFTATNTTGVPITAIITVTPSVASADGCAGEPVHFTITVKPTANVNVIPNAVYCNDQAIPALAFGSNVSTTTYTWSNSNTNIGLAATGNGNLPAFTATNTTGAPITAIITVTPSVASTDGCAGEPVHFTIIVKPTANVNVILNEIYCNNQAIPALAFGSNVTSTTYTWTNSNTAIGLAATGNGNLPAFTATNTTGVPITATITVTPVVSSADGCAGPAITFTITVKPTAIVTPIPSGIYCNNQAVTSTTFSSNVTSTTYTWTNSNTAIGLSATGNGNLPAFTATNTTGVPITATITVTPVVSSANGCAGEPVIFTITVKPTANVNAIPNEIYCNDQAIPALAFGSNVSTTTYTWSNNNTNIGLAATGNGNLPAFTAINTTGVPITATITVTPSVTSADGCAGEPVTFTITVKPTANVNVIPNEIYCNDQAVPALTFGSNVTSTTYTWTNSNTAIGLAATGNGNLPAFTATNTTGVPITAAITVTPVVSSADGCAGNPITFIITVKPTAKVTPVVNQVYCNNQAVTSVAFNSNVTSTTYTWINSNTSIGLAATGNGNLPAFTATNTTSTPITSTITVTPVVSSANGCAGDPITFTVTVKPTAIVTPIPSGIYCNNQAVTSTTFSSNIPSTTYTWTNSNTNIGLAATGTGNLPAFTATNTTSLPITATITVTPVIDAADGCAGNPITFTITVNPTATVTKPSDQIICNQSAVAKVIFTGTVNNTTYNWTNDQPTIGLAASGTGDISSFTAINTGSIPITAHILVTPVSSSGCAGTPVTFTITVNSTATLQLTSAASTANQTLCLNSSIQPITYSSPNSIISTSNLPAGLTTVINNDVFTITGTPTQSGVFHYTITATGICNSVQLSGTITINPLPVGFNDILSDLTCASNTLNYNLQDNINNTAKGGNSVPSSFSWTVAPNDHITGIANGSGNTINARLINTSGVTQQVIYTITPLSLTSGCPGTPFTLTVNILPCIGLSITKTADVTSVSKVGDQIKYTITVTNTATANHNNVKVTDPFLGGILTNPVSGDNGNGKLEANESWIYTGTYTLTQNDLDNNGKPAAGTGKIINTATVNSTEHPELLSASSTVDLQTASAINLVKTGTLDGSGSLIIFQFKITNTGTVTLKNISLTDPYLGGQINLSATTLAPGQSITLSRSYTITQADRDNRKVINTATVKAISSGGAEVIDVSGTEIDNDTPTTVVVGNHPAITLVKSGVISTDKKTIVYSFKITNTGDVTLSNIDLKDNKIIGAIILGKYTLEPGESVTGTATYTITDGERLDGRVSNTAKVTGDTFKGEQVSDISGTQANNDDPTLHIIDDTPQAMDDATSTKINEPVTYDITRNDIPSVNGLDKGTVRITRYPSNGRVIVNLAGTITYTPDKGYSGTDDFTYTVNDRAGVVSNVALVKITVIPTPIFIPNTFTPNGDGKNDTFKIIGRDAFDTVDLLIFNRWGNEVYRNKNYQDEWNGSGLNEGTYYYLITLKKGATSITQKGWILLKR